MHVERNRRAFLHVHNFKTFADELYLVRMYEDKKKKKKKKKKISDVISANKNVHRKSISYTPFYKTRQEFLIISSNLFSDINCID